MLLDARTCVKTYLRTSEGKLHWQQTVTICVSNPLSPQNWSIISSKQNRDHGFLVRLSPFSRYHAFLRQYREWGWNAAWEGDTVKCNVACNIGTSDNRTHPRSSSQRLFLSCVRLRHMWLTYAEAYYQRTILIRFVLVEGVVSGFRTFYHLASPNPISARNGRRVLSRRCLSSSSIFLASIPAASLPDPRCTLVELNWTAYLLHFVIGQSRSFPDDLHWQIAEFLLTWLHAFWLYACHNADVFYSDRLSNILTYAILSVINFVMLSLLCYSLSLRSCDHQSDCSSVE